MVHAFADGAHIVRQLDGIALVFAGFDGADAIENFLPNSRFLFMIGASEKTVQASFLLWRSKFMPITWQ